MGLRARFKKTEAGLIPEDWQIRPLLNAVRIASGQVDPRNEPYRSMILVAPDHVEKETGRLIRKSSAVDQIAISGKYLFEAGDVIYSKIRPYLRKAILADFSGLCSADMYPLRAAADVSPGYMFAVILGESFSNYAESVSVRSGMPKINRTEMADYWVALPPTKDEQYKIAEALSDADALIASLEQLLAKKRQIKQGTMQELLTGKRRLPGFSEVWATMRLEEIADIDPESLGAGTSPDYSFKYIALEDVQTGILKSYTDQNFVVAPSRARRKIKKNDILVSTVRPNLQSHLLFRSDGQNWVCSTGFCIVRCHEIISNPSYVFFHLFAGHVKRQIDALLTGSNYPAINRNDVRSLTIPFPKYDEQAAIATVLSSMDAEIATLEAKLTKVRQVKQGMMQELLTGRIRLR